MWQRASPQIKETYSKRYLMSCLPTPAEKWPPSDDVTPVVKAVKHALVSESPKTRYLVDGIGCKFPFFDEYAVIICLY